MCKNFTFDRNLLLSFYFIYYKKFNFMFKLNETRKKWCETAV